MSELTARLNLYGAIDEAVLEAGAGDSEISRRAARLLPQYERDLEPRARRSGARSTSGWFESLRRLVGPEALPRMALSDALHTLETCDHPSEEDAGRRLNALWATAQFFDDVEDEDLCRAARPLVGDDDPQSVVARLRDVRAATCEKWHERLDKGARAAAAPVTSRPLDAAAQQVCQDKLMYFDVETPRGTETEVGVVLTSKFETPAGGRKIADITGFTDPANWAKCLGSFWCEMKFLGTGADETKRYEEVVGDCPDNRWFTTCLRFLTDVSIENEITLVYDLCDDPDGSSDGKIRVDKGRIVVRLESDTFHVRTVKGLLFSEHMGTGGLGIAACVMGWGAVGREMFTRCA